MVICNLVKYMWLNIRNAIIPPTQNLLTLGFVSYSSKPIKEGLRFQTTSISIILQNLTKWFQQTLIYVVTFHQRFWRYEKISITSRCRESISKILLAPVVNFDQDSNDSKVTHPAVFLVRSFMESQSSNEKHLLRRSNWTRS